MEYGGSILAIPHRLFYSMVSVALYPTEASSRSINQSDSIILPNLVTIDYIVLLGLMIGRYPFYPEIPMSQNLICNIYVMSLLRYYRAIQLPHSKKMAMAEETSPLTIHTLPPCLFKSSTSISISFKHALPYPILSSYNWHMTLNFLYTFFINSSLLFLSRFNYTSHHSIYTWSHVTS